jgi:hypothetical protein
MRAPLGQLIRRARGSSRTAGRPQSLAPCRKVMGVPGQRVRRRRGRWRAQPDSPRCRRCAQRCFRGLSAFSEPQSSFAKDQISANSEARTRRNSTYKPLPPGGLPSGLQTRAPPWTGRGLEFRGFPYRLVISRTLVVIAQQFSNSFSRSNALIEADRAVKGLNQSNANVGDNHAQGFACDSSTVGVAGNVDGRECR